MKYDTLKTRDKRKEAETDKDDKERWSKKNLKYDPERAICGENR